MEAEESPYRNKETLIGSNISKKPRDKKFLIPFHTIKNGDEYVGSKAYILALLYQKGFPVPKGSILTKPPEHDSEWEEVIKWWQENGQKPLAVRSSYQGEDSENHSFAGQNKSFLDINGIDSLKKSILECFDSHNDINSKAYRDYFQIDTENAQMNVVLQEMVFPKYSGVFFQKNPNGKGWLIEFVEGFGEDLASGKKTPFQICPAKNFSVPEDWQGDFAKKIYSTGKQLSEILDFSVDMEWGIDFNGLFYVLQARPITAETEELVDHDQILKLEVNRLKNNNSKNTQWDGQTFSEWTDYPSYLTFSIWEDAFGPGNAFHRALKKLGYHSFDSKVNHVKESVLDRVFGRAYVNLEKLNTLYFGPIPYKIETNPRTALKFDLNKLGLKIFLYTPYLMYKMLKISWNLSTKKSEWLNESRKSLVSFKNNLSCPNNPYIYKNFQTEKLFEEFKFQTKEFSGQTLYWPFTLIFLTESALQSITSLLESIYDREDAHKLLNRWLAKGVHTVTLEMNNAFQKSCNNPAYRDFFISAYGHRGPGELDLNHPRWIELKEKAFFDLKDSKNIKPKKTDSVEQEINNIDSFKKSIILKEWETLQNVLELREQWKMAILKPYAEMRYIAIELSKRLNLGKNIFWLTFDELLDIEKRKIITSEILDQIKQRKKEYQVFKNFSLPPIIHSEKVEDIFGENPKNEKDSFGGMGISQGIAYGTAVFVDCIEKVNPDSWPEDAILVAEATDPGWTPLFIKAKGIVIEKGGLLSHCAIVAREMGIPAVSGILTIKNRIQSGVKVWVDGDKGRVTIER